MIEIVCIQKDKKAVLPTMGTPSSAAIDFYSVEEGEILPGKTKDFSTGLTVLFRFNSDWIEPTLDPFLEPNSFEERMKSFIFKNWKLDLQIEGRSGLALKSGINPIGGVVDEDYTGIIKIILANNSKKTYKVQIGDKIAQGKIELLPKISTINWGSEDEIPKTSRGEKGFGSTGK